MKFLGYILRNARRSPVRSLLTIGSTTMCLFLMMILFSFLDMQDSVSSSLRIYNRLVVMSSQGFAQPVPVSRLNEINEMDGVDKTTTFSWFGGKYNNETMPFGQFGVTPETMFSIYDELKIAPDQLKAFQDEKQACVIGRKLANERNIKVGDKLPLQGDGYPFDLDLVVRGIYDGSSKNSDLRTCYFHWDYLNEEFKKIASSSKMVDNAGIVVVKCTSADKMTSLKQQIDSAFANSDTPTRTQTEEAFNNMFAEMIGDLKGMIRWIGIAVVCSLIFVAGNAMAMALRERTTEVAVLKAIGFGRVLVVNLVLAEAVLVTLIGGLLGTLGSKAYFDAVDISKFAPQFLPFFFVPWRTALIGIGVSLGIGLVSGFIPAVRAAQLSVVNGLRKVV
jgi:putative ABC transport system permease protein